jgi:tetratricopeptide (TPR) repeat protein
MKIIYSITVLMISAVSANLHAAPAAPFCGDLTNAYGPFDYTNPVDKQHKLPVVEKHHFNSKVEKLIEGQTGPLGGDLDYTLRAFPNHHKALGAIAKLSLREKNPKLRGTNHSVLCYFDRAIRFKPDDGVVRMIYGDYLLKLGKPDQATEQFQEAIKLHPENPTINYNLGLLYLKQKDYEQAKTYAKKAYELGFPLPGLKNQLKEAGKWDE